MATPITHIVLAEKVYNKSFKDKERRDFFIGTLFPDVRYLGVIDRSKTHYDDLTLNDLKKENSFWAGAKFHSILDITREKFLLANNIYQLCPKSKYIAQSLKFLEDEILYQYINDWNVYINYLDSILPDEADFGVDSKDIGKWHYLLQQYFRSQPNEQTISDFMYGVGFSAGDVREINENISIIKTNEKIINILNNLYENFDSLIK